MEKITVIGESCLDEFVYCNTNRLSPEAPVPVLVPEHTVRTSGMAGNVKRNLEVLTRATNVKLITQFETITKTRYIDEKSNHMFLRVDNKIELEPTIVCDSFLAEHLQTQDIVIVSDYNKGFLSNEDLEFIGKHSKLSILDSKRILTKEIIDRFTWVKLNKQEAYNNSHIMDDDNVITTLGSQGAMWNNTLYPSPKPIETIDVSGAGDTFTASFIYKYYLSNNFKRSITYANEQAGKVVQKRGVSLP
jgi:D-beta-D-heptose 7-phosphate kinase/D-beta-D-heptose 1-phosphate adenosyltransferase